MMSGVVSWLMMKMRRTKGMRLRCGIERCYKIDKPYMNDIDVRHMKCDMKKKIYGPLVIHALH